MSKIARYAGNLPAFGSNAQGLERTVFGSTVQDDDLTSQVTDAFLRGWGIVGPSENPSLEDFNAAFYTVSQLIAYQHQMGVPEWEVKQEYYIGSVCSYKGELYVSLSNSNTGNEPPSAQWTPVITAKNGISKLGLGTAAKKDVGTGANQIPDMSLFVALQSTTGYQKLPSGLIIQWGVSGTTNGTGNALFPIAFPNAVFRVITSEANAQSWSTNLATFHGPTNLSTTGFTLRTIACTGASLTLATSGSQWLAIGY